MFKVGDLVRYVGAADLLGVYTPIGIGRVIRDKFNECAEGEIYVAFMVAGPHGPYEACFDTSLWVKEDNG